MGLYLISKEQSYLLSFESSLPVFWYTNHEGTGPLSVPRGAIFEVFSQSCYFQTKVHAGNHLYLLILFKLEFFLASVVASRAYLLSPTSL